MVRKRTTLKDIAEKLGVSKTLVSFVVRDMPDGHGNISVKPETRQQIKDLAKELNYIPHRNARALRTGHSKLIGVLSLQSVHPVHYAKERRIFNDITSRGYDYLLHDVDCDEPANLETAITSMLDYMVEGVILVDIPIEAFTEQQALRLSESGIPVTLCGGTATPPGACVRCSYYDAGYRMAQGLIDRGRRKMSIICRPKILTIITQPERIQGAQDACKNRGIAEPTVYVTKLPYSCSDIEVGYETTLELLKEQTPDCIFYTNDFMAFGGLRALMESGIKVPDDMYVCGFDGIELAKYSTPSLTTVIQHTSEMAIISVAKLFDVIEGESESAYQEIVVPGEVVYRESTGDYKPAGSETSSKENPLT